MFHVINIIVISIFSTLPFTILKGQNLPLNFKAYEGIFIYYNDDSMGYTPQEVLFIEHKIDRDRSLKRNVLSAIKSKKTALELIFIPMRHTQRFLFDRLAELTPPIDTHMTIISQSLGYSCEIMPKIDLNANLFPFGGDLSGKIKVRAAAGILAVNPLSDEEKKLKIKQGYNIKTGITKLKHGCHSYKLSYMYDQIGLLSFFLPLALKN